MGVSTLPEMKGRQYVRLQFRWKQRHISENEKRERKTELRSILIKNIDLRSLKKGVKQEWKA